MNNTETYLTLLGLLFAFGTISKLRNLHAYLHAICNHSIIKLKACLQKCRRSSSHKNFTLLGLLFAFGTISFPNSETFMRIYMLYATII